MKAGANVQIDVVLPDLENDKTILFTLERWMCRVGINVREGEPLLQVRSGTTIHLVPAPASGMLVKIRVEEGMEVRASAVVATLEK